MRILRMILLLGIVSVAEFSNGQVDTMSYSNMEYRSLGPSRGGRSTAVIGDLVDPDLFYMGSTGGGVWRTKDGGKSWHNISDGFFGGSIGSIAIAPSDNNVIYVGQGEESLRGNVSSGKGIWKSVDAGETWTMVGLDKSRHITRIAVHPRNPDIAFAAVLGDLYKNSVWRGIYRTENGGQSWHRVCNVSDEVGFNEVIYDPLNERVMYASSWRVRRSPHDFASGGEGSGLWKSTDGGNTWKNITENDGLPNGVVGKITVAPSRAQKNLVYVMIEHQSRGGLYRSEDAGKTWRHVNGEGKIRQRAWYFSRIYADPQEANTVYTMNVRFQKSTDGGKSFTAINTPHVDHHDLWIDPTNPRRMITGNDGGGQVTYNGGQSWSTYMNQPTEQFYRVSTDNHIPYRIYGAQQDNSTMRVNHLTGQWEPTAGGESAHITVDPKDNEHVFAGSYGGYLTRRHHTKNFQQAINVWPDNPLGYGVAEMKYRFQWNFPLVFSAHDSNKLYAASNHLHVSYDYGNSWEVISPDLTRNDPTKMVSSGGPITQDNTGVEYYCTIFAFEESKQEEGVLWVGSDDGLLHISKDNGKNWQNITPSGFPEWTMVNSIEVNPFEKGSAYVVCTSYKLGDNSPYIYKITEYGKKAKLITEGIENEHFVRVVRSSKNVQGLLFAGTERGMYISHNDGKSWSSFQKNLPIVPITDLTIKENDLIVATQGRGFWIIDNIDMLELTNASVLNESIAITATEDAYITYGDKLSYVIYLKDSLTQEDTLLMDLYFQGSEGDELVRTFSNQKFSKDTGSVDLKRGFNYYHWRGRYLPAYKPEGMIIWWGSVAGPDMRPGTYKLVCSLNGVTATRSAKLKVNPNEVPTEEDFEARYQFLKEVRDKLDEMHTKMADMQKLSRKLSMLRSRSEIMSNADMKELITGMTEELDSLVNDLYQTKLRSEQDPINFPIKLNNKLAHLGTLVRMGQFRPTNQALAVKKELTMAIDERLARFEEIKTTQVAKLNQLILDAKVPMLDVDMH